MPQLDLAPWFYILIVSWLLLATILPTKLLAHVFTKTPVDSSTAQPKTNNWQWPWFPASSTNS
uniref:ATP synthase complex subunit 8 n=1 Tax=Acropoma japonicum TaxID=223805 RepID=A0A1V1FVU9_ACRJP|nr:ATP synthase F0 subunit 8 [Synagrops japonicus]WNH22067.1 ATP synthase F0 subunit 8 [Synagrops bellus]BAX03725.1 ATPase subunit 8 [Synagrops japonicus]BBU25817.1 ATPase subunit 8 [Synagrops japonicus]